jgi:hypothetical protein
VPPAFDPGTKLVGTAASRQKRSIDPLDINPPFLHCLDTVGDFDEFARGGIRISKGMTLDELHAAARSSLIKRER